METVNNPSAKLITLVMVSPNGDDRWQLTLEETVRRVIGEYFQRSLTPYVGKNTVPFQFSATSATDKTALAADTARLHELLNDDSVVEVFLMGALVGGR